MKHEFQAFPEGLELSTFIWMMLCVLEFDQKDKLNVILGLIQLYKEVDINDNKHIGWTDFTQYIIDSVMQQKSLLDNS